MDKEKIILIVDDIEINRVILSEIFKKDYHIIEACNGIQALEAVNKKNEQKRETQEYSCLFDNSGKQRGNAAGRISPRRGGCHYKTVYATFPETQDQ